MFNNQEMFCMPHFELLMNGADKKKYIQVLKREKIFDILLQNTLKRKVKRICIKIKYGAF